MSPLVATVLLPNLRDLSLPDDDKQRNFDRVGL
jgi:hypothetical protein